MFLVRFSRPRIQKVLHRIEFYKRRGWGEKEEHRGGRGGHFAVIGRFFFSKKGQVPMEQIDKICR